MRNKPSKFGMALGIFAGVLRLIGANAWAFSFTLTNSDCESKELSRILEGTCVQTYTKTAMDCDAGWKFVEESHRDGWVQIADQSLQLTEIEIWKIQILATNCDVIERRFWGALKASSKAFRATHKGGVFQGSSLCEDAEPLLTAKIDDYVKKLRLCK
ncbi:MAG: hypothetical protein NTV34_12025 [Proteobacteria bacterium]|nr:hypothetical protein [Pseudomonadota bacterium]